MKKLTDLIPCISIVVLVIYLIRDYQEEKRTELTEI